MKTIVVPLLATLMDLLRSWASLQLEVLALERNVVRPYILHILLNAFVMELTFVHVKCKA